MRSFLHFIIIGCIVLGLLLIVFEFFKITIYNKVIVPQLNHPTYSLGTDKVKLFNTIIDARTVEEFSVSHLKGAVLYKNELSDSAKKDSVLVYCTVGKRSSDLVKELKQKDFEKVYNLEGGIISYANNGLTTYKNFDSPSDSIHTYSMIWSLFLDGEKVAVY